MLTMFGQRGERKTFVHVEGKQAPLASSPERYSGVEASEICSRSQTSCDESLFREFSKTFLRAMSEWVGGGGSSMRLISDEFSASFRAERSYRERTLEVFLPEFQETSIHERTKVSPDLVLVLLHLTRRFSVTHQSKDPQSASCPAVSTCRGSSDTRSSNLKVHSRQNGRKQRSFAHQLPSWRLLM